MKKWLFALTVIPAILALSLLNPSEDNPLITGSEGSDFLCCAGWEDNLENDDDKTK